MQSKKLRIWKDKVDDGPQINSCFKTVKPRLIVSRLYGTLIYQYPAYFRTFSVTLRLTVAATLVRGRNITKLIVQKAEGIKGFGSPGTARKELKTTKIKY